MLYVMSMSEAATLSAPTTTASTVLRPDLKVGGKYTAVDNGDGTFNILDVCIFAEIPAGVKRNAEPIGREWQEAALLQNQAREAEGHLPPVHVYHTDEKAVKPVYAGKMKLRNVRQITYEGQKRWATFADILGMPGDVFAKVQRGFLSYRSVEIHNWDKPEIDSLALMDTDVPFFRMPMLTIGAVLRKEADMFMDKTHPSVACRLGKKQGGVILFKFDEGRPMAEDEDKDKKKPADDKGLNAAPEAGETEAEAEADLDEKAEGPARKGPGGAEMEDDGADPTAEKPEAILEGAEHEQKEESKLDMVLSMMQSIGTMLGKLNERLGPQPAANEKLEPVNGLQLGQEAMGQDFKNTASPEVEIVIDREAINKIMLKEEAMADPKQPEKVVMSAADLAAFMDKSVKGAVLEATGPILAELNALKAKQAEADKVSQAEALFKSAVKELQDNGQSVSEELEKHLKESAGQGAEFLKKQVAVFKSTLPKEPPADAGEFEADLTKQDAMFGDDSEINEFVAKNGPQSAEFARKQLAEFRNWQKTSNSDMTLSEWLTVNFRSATMAQRNRV